MPHDALNAPGWRAKTRGGFDPLEWAQMALDSASVGHAWAKADALLARFGYENRVLVIDQPTAVREVPPDIQKFGPFLDADWETRLRTEPGLATGDPIAKRFLSSERPLHFWRGSPLYQSFSPREQRFFRNFEEHGSKAGAVWSSHDKKNGTAHVLATWTPREALGDREAIARYSDSLHLALIYFCEALRVTALARGSDWRPLSPRERECLLWVQVGRSSSDIGDTLAIAEATVNEHILNAMNKLSATNRAQAAARATMLDLIQP